MVRPTHPALRATLSPLRGARALEKLRPLESEAADEGCVIRGCIVR